MEEAKEGQEEDWVRRHQELLEEAYSHVRQRLAARWQYRDQKQEAQVRDPSLSEGNLVHVQNHGIKGRNKIQDVLGSNPLLGGAVTPAVQGGSVR